MHAETVVDIGCGTGTLLHRARETGHRGRLIGIDPDDDMLAMARRRDDIEWQTATASDVRGVAADLVTMTGHAFQTLASDDDLTSSLRAIVGSMAAGGRFAFETRNPLVQPWTRWDEEFTVTDDRGDNLTVTREVVSVQDQIVTFDETFSIPELSAQRIVRSSLRFLTVDNLSTVLRSAGLVIEEQFGNWDRSPVTPESPEIITIASTPTAG